MKEVNLSLPVASATATATPATLLGCTIVGTGERWRDDEEPSPFRVYESEEAHEPVFVIEHPEVARALEQDMLHATIHCLVNEANDDHKTRHHHAAAMARFEKALNRHLDQKLKLPELCSEIGVPERTLRLCCAEFLGLSPTRYLLLRRLNDARAALRRADPSTATVAQVAREHHFLELGRFAVTYRTTFGESPSATLQRDPWT